MAATAWCLYTKAIQNIGKNNINLTTATPDFRIALFGSGSDCSTTAGVSAITELSSEVVDGNGYSTSGDILGSKVWTVSGEAVKFDVSDHIFTASGGNIAGIKYAVIHQAGKLLCWCRLTTAQFTLTDGNTLTIQMNSAGVFKIQNA